VRGDPFITRLATIHFILFVTVFAMSFVTNTQAAIRRLISLYQQCDDGHQALLQILAVIYKKIGQAKFKTVLVELGRLDSFNHVNLTQAFTPAAREQLADLGLIDVSSKGMSINPLLANYLCHRCAEDGSYEEIGDAAERVVPVQQIMHWATPELCDRQRIIRDHFYYHRFDICNELLEAHKNPQIIDHQLNHCLVELCFYPFEPTLFSRLPPPMQYQAFATLLNQLRDAMRCNVEVVELLEQVVVSQPGGYLTELLVEQYVLSNRVDLAASLLAGDANSSYALQLQGALMFLQAKPDDSVFFFEQAIKAKNKINRRKKQYIGGTLGLFYGFALLQLGSDADPSRLGVLLKDIEHQFSDNKLENHHRATYLILSKFAMILMGKTSQFVLLDPNPTHHHYFGELQTLIGSLCLHWANERPSPRFVSALETAAEYFSDMGDALFAQIAHQILFAWRSAQVKPAVMGLDIAGLIVRKESWALALEQLIALDQSAPSNAPVEEKETRLIWLFYPHIYDPSFEAKEQKRGKQGWSKGRTVALKRLSNEIDSFSYLTEADKELCKTVTRHNDGGYYGREYYELSGYKTLNAAVGMDNIYVEDNLEQAVVIERVDPELLITQNSDGFLLSMANIPSDVDSSQWSYSLTKHSSYVYWLTRFDPKHLQIASIVGEGGIVVPQGAKEKVLQSISAIAPMLNIQSDLQGIETGVDTVMSDKRLFINIEPAGEGLMFDCHVEPLGQDGPKLSPGLGLVTFATQVNDKRVSTTRDLLHEQRQLQLLTEQCPSFEQMIDCRLVSDRLDDALFALEQLEQACVSNENIDSEHKLDVVMQWPKGKKFKLSPKLGSDHLKLSITKQKEWFGLEGTLEVAEDRIVELKTLMSLISQSTSRFIQLDDSQILSLTDELRKRLQTLEQITVDGKFHPLASPLIDSATQGMRLKTLDAWQRQRDILQQAEDFEPQLPSTLQAQLRDYQVDGFNWASRLAFWGGGACLADDMGLGKTLQALAVILSRASEGPTLVLAPTSVCFNWQQEAQRFAPTLKVKMFGESGDIDKREQLLNECGAFDLVICSYGILQREGERLAKVKWQSIVADEAQALKNPLAKRTQAAMGLSAHFKMITTGTPIENNLTELWTLFRFINPGLLGSQKQFHKRFAGVIENTKESDKGAIIRANQALRQLISPFILRRMKNQVLTELPSRTEINVSVELSEEEIVLYEALRQQAVENLSQGDIAQGQHHIKMLSELMKLRRACCHPSLVMPGSLIPGSKLKAFDNLMSELVQNNHKALVFSQFVGHLQILKNHLDAKGISYQYLDGSTPIKARTKAVNEFQAGKGDVFLISLKAGGSGLNLTAADYVIHMDPWWNPAVEDQASDRAHRMGQTRPVTIYRLIAKNTIEDKIVALHQHKRDLANSLLEGTDGISNLSANDMMALLQTPM